MTEIMPFEYEGQPVRTVEINGKTWFVARDVCNILGLDNITEALRGLDDDEKSQVTKGSGLLNPWIFGTANEVRLVNEPGLYALISRSRKPEAKAFMRWIYHVLLPQVRETGQFSMERLTPRQLAELVIQEADRADRAENGRELAEARVAELEPLAGIARAIAAGAESNEDDWSLDEVAKLLMNDPVIAEKRPIGRDRLIKYMVEWGWVFWSEGDRRHHPKQAQVEKTKRLTVRIYRPVYDSNGQQRDRTPGIRVTWKGMMEIHRRLGGSVPLQDLMDQQKAQQNLRAVGDDELDETPWWNRD